MKKSIITILLCVWAISSFSQTEGSSASKEISKIPISFYKSAYLYFPTEITEKPDLGFNEDIDIVYANNELKITAIANGFNYETNLTVKTVDGIYAFSLYYQEKPKNLYHKIKKERAIFKNDTSEVKKETYFSSNGKYNGEKDKVCEDIFKKRQKRTIAGIKDGDMLFLLESIHIHNDRLYFKVVVQNSSNINYDIEFIKFHVENKKKLTKSAVQEIYKEPLYIKNKKEVVNSNEYLVQIFVFDKFNFSNNKELLLELYEKKGSRHMVLPITRKQIIKASPVK